ncbi:MAG: hypothetical protein E7622_02875 [Ruminococcaceae bacterium]|nr:hypothetical protein [Oscillospiraceae bacterium]
MTMEQLKRLHALNKEIELEKERLYSMRCVQGRVNLNGIALIYEDDFAEDVAVLEEKIKTHLKDCLALYREILDFVNAIPDPLIRLIVSLRYINGLEWEQVALHIGGGNTGESVRKACERHLRRYLKK